MNRILNIKEGLNEDESIVAYELYQFYPEVGTQYNNPGNLTISVQNSDNFYHPARSWLEFEGQVVKKADSQPYTKDNVVSFVNYGILYLFDLIKYTLNNMPIETVFNPGLVANIFGLATFPNDFKQGLIECWAPDTTDTLSTTDNLGLKARQSYILGSEPDPLGSFSFAVPLKRIFGFADDYGKVLYGFTHHLILTRSSSDNNALIHTGTGVTDAKVVIKNIRWMLPRVTPNDMAKLELMEQIKNEITLNCGFRMRQHIAVSVPPSTTFTWRLGVRSSPEQPRFIFLCFQKGREENQAKINSVFDDIKLSNAHVLLNNDRYPLNDFENDFKNNRFDVMYTDFAGFRKKFYGIDPIISPTFVGPAEYKTLYPIVCFDVSKQSERLKSGVTDITLQCKFAKTPVQTDKWIAHVVMVSDRKLKFKSDGEKLSVIF